MSATPNTSALKALHPDLRRRLQRLDSLERQAQQTRANRWRAPPAPGRDSDSWLVTYLDLVTLLLVMLVVLLGLSRMPNARTPDATVTATAAVAGSTTPTPDAAAPLPGVAPVDVPATPLPSEPLTATPSLASARAAEPSPAPAWVQIASAASVLIDPDATALPARDATASAVTSLAHVLPGDAATPTVTPTALVEPTAPRQAPALPTAVFPPLALVEDGPWTGTRLRLPNPDTPTRWSLPGFAALAEDTPPAQDQPVAAPPPAPEAAPPSLDGLGLGDLGEGIDVIVNAQSVSFRISNEILFPSGQSDLAIAGPAVLDRLANVLARNPYPLSVEGHTDIIPIQNERFPSNWELATARATSVVRYLSRHGIAADRMRAVGYAHTRPLATNDTPEGRSTNRRVELIMDIPPAP